MFNWFKKPKLKVPDHVEEQQDLLYKLREIINTPKLDSIVLSKEYSLVMLNVNYQDFNSLLSSLSVDNKTTGISCVTIGYYFKSLHGNFSPFTFLDRIISYGVNYRISSKAKDDIEEIASTFNFILEEYNSCQK